MLCTSSITWSLAGLLTGWSTMKSQFEDIKISGLSLDSRNVQPGDLFFALQGEQIHGLQFIKDVIENGAAAIVWEEGPNIGVLEAPETIPCIPVKSLRQKVGLIAKRFYQNPSKFMHVIAVTGTDGKTSVSNFVSQAFSELSIPCGVIGTLGNGVYPNLNAATHTTPDAIRLQALLQNFYTENVMHTVIEASSHGLKQGRLNGVEIDTAIFTNLGHDHMDYHKNAAEYANSKRILFSFESLKNAVINIDDDFGKQLVKDLDSSVDLVTYSNTENRSTESSYIFANAIIVTQSGMRIEIVSTWGNATLETKVFGRFNCSNILATIGALLVNKCPFDDALKAVSSIQTVPGRMEFVSRRSKEPQVFVDYAHTPQALNNVLQALQVQSTGNLWCVFGCGGDRDPSKRPLMAKAVETFADFAVITDDNPRTEDPTAIAKDIIRGFSTSANYQLIHDRKEAIAHAIKNASPKDTILIAGKGHEVVQIIDNRADPFDDKKVASQLLSEIVI